jgi:hypothetical protein
MPRPNDNSWVSHPIISLIVWALGTDKSNSKEEAIQKLAPADLDFDKEYFSSVGNISEYIEEIQQVEEDIGENAGTQLIPRIIHTRSESESNESPQWGFYVSITPPHQYDEYYPKNKPDIQKVNEEYHRNSTEPIEPQESPIIKSKT